MTPSMLLLLPMAWAATGSIFVEAEDDVGLPVKGGQVMLDGFPTGSELPGVLANVPTGKHRVSVKVGCGQGEAAVTVAPEKTAKVFLELESMDGYGTVRLKGVPDGARVRFDTDDVDASKGSFESPCGTHVLRVSAPGFAPWEQEVVVTVDEWTAVNVALERGDMADGRAVAAAGASRGGDFFEDDLDDDFAFDEEDDFGDEDEDDAFIGGGAAAASSLSGGTTSDSFLDEDDKDGDDGYVPPSVSRALAGEDLDEDPPEDPPEPEDEDDGGGAVAGAVAVPVAGEEGA
ncbi:MAG: PEGA domain-containing protein, partial [Myxococcota bacterium]|nr:PEGA domain-containing protein [Myxococcota bacterium]